MKIRTERKFGGRQVRLGDTAIVCVMDHVWNGRKGSYEVVVVARAAHCFAFADDDPSWCIVGELVGKLSVTGPKLVQCRFVETEMALVPGTWTW